jgi:hypothetical protein
LRYGPGGSSIFSIIVSGLWKLTRAFASNHDLRMHRGVRY